MSDGHDGADFDGGGHSEGALDFDGCHGNAPAGGGHTATAAEIGDGGDGHGYVSTDSSGHAHADFCDFTLGFAGSALSCMGITHGVEEMCMGRRVKLPGIAWNDRVVQVLAWPHGQCDAAELVRCLAEKQGLFNLARRKRDLVDSPSIEADLIDTTPFDGRKHNTPMPSGWYPGATGFTRTFKQYWQMGSRRYFWSEYELDLSLPVHILVQSATWFYNEVGDFETRIAFMVKSKGELDGVQWRYRQDLIAKHLLVARVLCDQVLTALKEAPPLSAAVIQRQLLSQSEAYASGQVQRPAVKPVASGNPASKTQPVTAGGSADPLAFDMST